MPIQNDGNAGEIVKALRAAGACVEYWVPHARQKGLPDIVVSIGGRIFLMEIKIPGAQKKKSQLEFHARWQSPIFTVHSVAEALAVIGVVA